MAATAPKGSRTGPNAEEEECGVSVIEEGEALPVDEEGLEEHTCGRNGLRVFFFYLLIVCVFWRYFICDKWVAEVIADAIQPNVMGLAMLV